VEDNKLTIRNSTAEFLIFSTQVGENTIETRFEDDSIWPSQKMKGKTLFDVEIIIISRKYIKLKN
jgi:hypothetical protein